MVLKRIRKAFKRKPKKLPFKDWKKASDVEWLKFGGEKIGGGHYGHAFLGKIKFKGKKPLRVVVKEFRPGRNIDLFLDQYRTAIEKLSAEGINLPKMDFVKHEGQWVLVSQAFVKGGKTKLKPSYSLADKKVAEEYFTVAAKTLNAGYPFYGDLVQYFKGSFVPFDIDELVRYKRALDRNPNLEIGREIAVMSVLTTIKPEHKKHLFSLFLKTLKNKKYKKLAEKHIKNEVPEFTQT